MLCEKGVLGLVLNVGIILPGGNAEGWRPAEADRCRQCMRILSTVGRCESTRARGAVCFMAVSSGEEGQ